LKKLLLIGTLVASPALANIPVPEIETTQLTEAGTLLINSEWLLTPTCELKGKQIDLLFERREIRPKTTFHYRSDTTKRVQQCQVKTLVKL